MRPIVILVTGEAVAPVRAARGDFSDWIRDTVGQAWRGDYVSLDVRGDAALPLPEDAAALVLTGSSSSVTERAPWMLRVEAYLRAAVDQGAPVLGICFGHQLLAQALGGQVEKNPRGRELGTVRLDKTEAARKDPIFSGLPSAFDVNASHVDAVVRLPDRATVLATTALDHAAAFSVGASAWGVQFHPEFDGDVVRGYVRARSEAMIEEGLRPDDALAAAKDAPHGRDVLPRFIAARARR